MSSLIPIRRALVPTTVLALCGLLAAPALAQGQTQSTASSLGTPPPAARQAERHLLAWETEPARLALEGWTEGPNVWVTTARGRILAQNKEYEAAAAKLREAAAMDGSNPVPLLHLGDTLAYADQREAANEAYSRTEARARRLLETAPEDPVALYLLGVSEQRRKLLSESAANLQKARALRPEDPLILLELGTTRFLQESWQQAFDLLTAALEKNSGLAYAYYFRGLACARLDRKDLLVNDLDRFVKMAPSAPEAANAQQILASFR